MQAARYSGQYHSSQAPGTPATSTSDAHDQSVSVLMLCTYLQMRRNMVWIGKTTDKCCKSTSMSGSRLSSAQALLTASPSNLLSHAHACK